MTTIKDYDHKALSEINYKLQADIKTVKSIIRFSCLFQTILYTEKSELMKNIIFNMKV